MDIEKLIEQLRKSADFEDYPIVASFAAIIEKKYLRDAATALSTLQAENEKLRAELENYRKGHCSEGGCAAEKDRDAVLAELEQVKAERDAAVSWAQKFTESIDRPCVACKHNTGDYVCTAICGNCGPMGTESCKWEFDFSGELKED